MALNPPSIATSSQMALKVTTPEAHPAQGCKVHLRSVFDDALEPGRQVCGANVGAGCANLDRGKSEAGQQVAHRLGKVLSEQGSGSDSGDDEDREHPEERSKAQRCSKHRGSILAEMPCTVGQNLDTIPGFLLHRGELFARLGGSPGGAN